MRLCLTGPTMRRAGPAVFEEESLLPGPPDAGGPERRSSRDDRDGGEKARLGKTFLLIARSCRASAWPARSLGKLPEGELPLLLRGPSRGQWAKVEKGRNLARSIGMTRRKTEARLSWSWEIVTMHLTGASCGNHGVRGLLPADVAKRSRPSEQVKADVTRLLSRSEALSRKGRSPGGVRHGAVRRPCAWSTGVPRNRPGATGTSGSGSSSSGSCTTRRRRGRVLRPDRRPRLPPARGPRGLLPLPRPRVHGTSLPRGDDFLLARSSNRPASRCRSGVPPGSVPRTLGLFPEGCPAEVSVAAPAQAKSGFSCSRSSALPRRSSCSAFCS